jgi:hypothetical protein
LWVFSHSFQSTTSAKNYLAGIKTWRKFLRYETSPFENHGIRLIVQGVPKLSDHIPISKLSLTYTDLRKMVNLLHIELPIAACMCLYLHAVFVMLRVLKSRDSEAIFDDNFVK